jgi:UDP-glucose 4-epimerase
MLDMAVQAKVNKFIYASSAAPLGEQTPPLNEQKLPRPLSPYGASKLSSEAYCSAYSTAFKLETIVLRFSNVYGPKSYKKGSVVAKFIKQLLANERVEIYGTGEQTRDFIHVSDICNAIYLAMISILTNSFEIFQIGSGMETTVNHLFSTIKKTLPIDNSNPKTPIYREKRQGEILRNFADIKKANLILGYNPSVELTEGIENTIRWFIGHYKKIA